MNWRLVFLLSLFGLAMGIGSVYWISSSNEWIFWLVIFLISAYLIAKNAPGKYFLHGFMVSIFNSIWITAIHYFMFDTYYETHRETMLEYEAQPMPIDMRTMMVVMGPIIGVVSGLVLGLFSYLASKFFKKNAIG